MTRKPIKVTDQAAVLLKSRRRCCICFGLNRDTSIQQGQIAHLDGNSANNAEANLAFICFIHHDQYDSTTRQSKNFTPLEVKEFRAELYRAIDLAFGSDVLFGEARAKIDNVSGHYIRSGDFESAELTVARLSDGRYHVTGLALWGVSRKYGPNLGELDFIGELQGRLIRFASSYRQVDPYLAVLTFDDRGLSVSEENWVGEFGMNVNFSGVYARAN